MHENTAGFAADTEILTRRGWLTFDQLADTDEVATRSPAGKFRWQVPTDRRSGQYDGEMIRFGGRSLDFLVTPNHFMFYSREGASRAKERVEWAWSIEHLDGARLIGTSIYDAPDLDGKTFRAIARAAKGPAPREITMTGDQYAAFMGMWLSEGCAFAVAPNHDWRTCISQTRAGKGYDEYRDVLIDIFGTEPMRNCDSWHISSRALYDYLAPFGKAKVKYIPREVLDLSRRQLRIFWDFYFLGDGTYATSDQQVMATASREMAGNLQEVIQKLGWSASMRSEISAANGLVKSSNLIYKLGVRKSSCQEYKASRVPYAGLIYGVTVPDEIAYVRRNGRAAWCIA
jgi:hypothetical protein